MSKRFMYFALYLCVAIFALNSSAGMCQKSPSYVQVVNKAPTTTGIGSSSSIINIGQTVQFSASVTPTKPTVPTGTVTFTATGSNSANAAVSSPIALSASGSATWPVTLSGVDSYTVTAQYNGDSNYLSSSRSLAQVVEPPPDFSLGLPSSITIVKGESSSDAISITGLNGFAGTVTLSCDGAPYKSTCGFSNASVVVANSSSSTSNAKADGSNNLMTGTASTALTLSTAGISVTAVSGLLLFGFGGLRRRKILSYIIAGVGLLGVFSGLSGCIGSNRYIQDQGTPIGSYTIKVVATSGSISHSGTTILNVVAK
jgi:hypothetical protein